MALTQYCEPAEVRAVLGVNDLELSDQTISLPVHEMGLLRELTKISSSLPAAFSTISAKDEADRSDAENDLFSAVRLFSVYAVARQAGIPLAIFAPKDVGDGKASVARFSGTPWRDVLDGVEKAFDSAKTDVRSALEAIGTSSGSIAPTRPTTAFVVAGRAVDPVTGA